MEFEKDQVATMSITNFLKKERLLQKARHELVPMRKAAMDAFLLTASIYIGLLIFPGILLSYPWLFLPVYALAYLLLLVLRLRQAARETTEPRSPYNYLFH